MNPFMKLESLVTLKINKCEKEVHDWIQEHT